MARPVVGGWQVRGKFRVGLGALVALTVWGCDGAEGEESGPVEGAVVQRAGGSRQQGEALLDLASRGLRIDAAEFAEGLKLLEGRLSLPGEREPERALVEAAPELFGRREPRLEAELPGGRRVMALFEGGRRVEGALLTFTRDGAGELVRVDGHVPPSGMVELPPARLDALQAEAWARVLLAQELSVAPDGLSLIGEPVAAVSSEGLGCWQVTLERIEGRHATRRRMELDDQHGRLLRSLELLSAVQGQAMGLDGRLWPLEVLPVGSGFVLRSPRVVTHAWHGVGLPGGVVTSATVDGWEPTATSAHAHAEAFLAHLEQAQGFHGIDGRGAPALVSIHWGGARGGGFWSGEFAVFGDGDGVTEGPAPLAPDVVAHELAHGVIASTARLGAFGEEGAVNEAVADALAALASRAAGKTALQAWCIGRELVLPPLGRPCLRDLARPELQGQPSTRSAWRSAPLDAAHDDGNVHENATVFGHALFLLAEGGRHATTDVSVVGLGPTRTETLLMDALQRTLPAGADAMAFARALERSAVRLFGKAAARSVRQAFRAVELPLSLEPSAEPPRPGDVEPNDARRQASPMHWSDRLAGRIGTPGDIDHLTFTLATPRTLTFELDGHGDDVDLALLSATGRIAGRSEQPGGAVERLVVRLDAGTWWVRIRAGRVGTATPAWTLEAR